MSSGNLGSLTRRRSPFLALAATMILFVLWLSDFWTFVFIGAIAAGLVALSVGVVYGRTGMVSLCQFSFAGVSVWVIAWLNVHTGLPFVVNLLLGAAAAVPFGLVIGLLSLRLRGVNLAVATLGFASASLVVLRRNPFPGSFSNQIIERPAGFTTENGYFLFCCMAFAAVVGLLAVVGRSRVGKAWLAVRQSERATASLGLSVARVKLAAFSTGAFIAGLGGGLLAGQNGLVSNRSFEPFDSLTIFAVSVLVGARYVDGALAAGLLGAVLPELFRKWGVPLDVAPMLFGLGAIAVLSKGADGAHGQLRTVWAERSGLRRAKVGRPDDPPIDAPVSTVASEPGPPAASASKTLALDGVSVSYGSVVALDNVTMGVEPGRIHGLIGPNGAGKSTLIDVVAGFVQPRAGTIRLGATDLRCLSVHSRAQAGLRRTFQQGRTIEELQVGEYLDFAAGHSLDAAAADELLGFFGCPAADRPIASIDVGTRRVVEVAAAVGSAPSIVMLDEPGAGLAGAESADLARRIAQVPSRFGCAVLLVEHDMEMVRIACDDLTVLDFGTIIASGKPQDVLSDPRVIAAYLGTAVGAST